MKGLRQFFTLLVRHISQWLRKTKHIQIHLWRANKPFSSIAFPINVETQRLTFSLSRRIPCITSTKVASLLACFGSGVLPPTTRVYAKLNTKTACFSRSSGTAPAMAFAHARNMATIIAFTEPGICSPSSAMVFHIAFGELVQTCCNQRCNFRVQKS